ncbi:MAG: alanine--tRNA ligase [Acetobacteraceae bacterium]
MTIKALNNTTAELRATFLNYFKSCGHEVIPSASLIPQNDPSLMFTNAGMVPFKNVFLGQETRPYRRAATAQKVVRAGGKHNDLDNVGYTARHLTFFEMMGNFSFGDYFKAEAIEFVWTLLTKGFALPKEKLLATIYAKDEEAASLWRRIAGLSDDRIIRIGTNDNFWRMGDTGPCGPCSEIFYDHGPDVWGGPPCSPEEDGDRFVEIWNLVFMQFFEGEDGTRSSLPRPSIDTGMGLERFAAVMQGKQNVWETDLLYGLVEATAALTHTDTAGTMLPSQRVVADHLRSSAFLISDGVLPARDGRGYVLRRIMRRAMRHLKRLGATEPMFYRLVPKLVSEMGAAYPELRNYEALITETMRGEEERFIALLDRGIALLDQELDKLGTGAVLPGDVAFKLYDTYGFPLDLTQDALRERHVDVDVTGFETAMQSQRARARAAWTGSGDKATDSIWFDAVEKFGATDFAGYDSEKTEATIQMIVKGGDIVLEAAPGDEIAVILDRTVFYGESGGQAGDHGHLSASGIDIEITETQRRNHDLIVHYGTVRQGPVRVGTSVTAEINGDRRRDTRAHHSATHLLHEALRRKLGAHVTQKGSLNDPDRLRFDFSHPQAMSAAELQAVEQDVNAMIRASHPVLTREMTPESAQNEGAMALFGEKYGEKVRVVSMGAAETDRNAYSIELCGGTHVHNTGEIGVFRILSESGVAAGVRRIEAMCGRKAEELARQTEQSLKDIAALLRVPVADAKARVQSLMDERKLLERKLADLQVKMASATTAADQEKIGDITFIPRYIENLPARELRNAAENAVKKQQNTVIAALSNADGKGSVVIGVTPDLTDKVDAVSLVWAAGDVMGGKGGGGSKTLAQAGGPNPEKDRVFAKMREILAQI